jgi:transcriptional regulator with XRE-family HTH domain
MPKFREFEGWRKSAGLGQEALAKKLGKSQRQISEWETGARSIPFDIMPKLRKLGYAGPVKPQPGGLTYDEVDKIVEMRLTELESRLIERLLKGEKDI